MSLAVAQHKNFIGGSWVDSSWANGLRHGPAAAMAKID